MRYFSLGDQRAFSHSLDPPIFAVANPGRRTAAFGDTVDGTFKRELVQASLLSGMSMARVALELFVSEAVSA
jgi:hypothetical protein